MIFARDFLQDQRILRDPFAPATPTVSVVLATYSRCRNGMLERSIASVLSQTWTDFEFIVLDDGSTDGSYELIEKFRTRDARLVHVRHERNSGIPSVRLNEGIELARGSYIAFQFDDDVWHPTALQALTAKARCRPEPVVVVGHSRFYGGGAEWVLPVDAVSQVTLHEQNRFANNAVLLPRDVVTQYGMYDCHIGMRRLCDWDLWLRYIKHVPFVVIDDVVSDVFEANPGSLGLTVPWDLSLFRFIHDIPRSDLLTIDHWRDYRVDSLRIGDVEIPKDIRRRLYEGQIVPYYLKFRHYFPSVEGFPATLEPPPQSVLCAKSSYAVSNDVTLGLYDLVSQQRGNYKAHFEFLKQVVPDWVKENDALLLVRPVEDAALPLMDQALSEGIPVGLYLDDDLLNFHEYGAKFNYLAPGTPYHRNLTVLLQHSDTVWVTNRYLEESVRPFSARTIPHNNAIPQGALPASIRPRDPEQPLRIGYAGSGYRIEEFRQIWEALRQISREFGDQVRFVFWGLDVANLPQLASPVEQRPFTFSDPTYLSRLRDAEFDILLTPLLDQPRPHLAESLIKYYETAVAGALGIFSDVPPYQSLLEGLTCLKAKNSVDAWYDALRRAITMPREQFDLMRQRALEHVREEYTERAQIQLHEAAWRATEFHANTRQARHADGRPRVVYALHSAHFGGGEIQLWRRLHLARRYGIEPIVVLPRVLMNTEAALRIAHTLEQEGVQLEFADYTCFDTPRSPQEFQSEREREDIRNLLQRCAPAVVHTVTFVPTFGQICKELGIPHVASLYAVTDAATRPEILPGFTHSQIVQSDSLRYAERWGDLLGVEKFCSRELVPEAVFALGQVRYLQGIGAPYENKERPVRITISGTLQERKRQFETIEAVGTIIREGYDCQLDIYGYTHFFPEYLEKCERRIRDLGLSDRIKFRSFTDDVVDVLRSTDIVLSLSTYESFPSAIKEAMAAGVLVVATPVGGIPELVIDGVSGILCADTSVQSITESIHRALALSPHDRWRIIQQARRVARSEFRPQRVACDLMTMYNRAIRLTHKTDSEPGHRRHLAVPAAVRPNIVEQPARPPAGFVPIRSSLYYHVVPRRAHWNGLDILVGTNQRSASGQLELHVLTPGGQVLRETRVDLAPVHDNDWIGFRFAAIANSTSQQFVAKFTLANTTPQTRLSVYETTPPDPKLHRLLRRAGFSSTRDSLYCRLYYDRASE